MILHYITHVMPVVQFYLNFMAALKTSSNIELQLIGDITRVQSQTTAYNIYGFSLALLRISNIKQRVVFAHTVKL